MENAALRRILQRIADTRDEEISCTECFAVMSEVVDREVGGQAPASVSPRLAQHLRQCGVCREEYETLRDLVQLDADGSPPASRPS